MIDRVLSEGADLGIAWDGDADRCFFIDDTGEFVDGDFLTALLARQVLAKHPGATILYDVRASRAVPDTVARARRHSHIEPGRPRLLQDRDARARRGLRRRGLGPLLLPRLLVRRLGHDPGAAGARAALDLRQAALRAGRRVSPSATSSPARSTPRSPTRRRRCASSPSATPTPRSAGSTGSRSTTRTGTSTSGPRTPSRCCGSTSNRSSRARTWRQSATRSSSFIRS